MARVTGKGFEALFASFEHTAWRLETRTAYNIDYEAAEYQRFLAGKPRNVYPAFKAWLDMIKTATVERKRFARVRVVPDPLTEYLRFEAAGCRFNVGAGEDIRYLDADRADELGLPRNDDFWLFDSIRIARLHFDDDDRPLGAELIDDPVQVVEANRLRDAAWHYAVPYTTWIQQVEGAGEQRQSST